MKKEFARFTLLVIVLTCHSVTSAQTATVAEKDLTWHSERCVEKHSGIIVNSTSRVEVHASASVDLVIQEQTISFSIESVTGSWASEDQDGSLEYSISYDNMLPGKMVITRSGGQIMISLNMTEVNADGINFDFFIDRVTRN